MVTEPELENSWHNKLGPREFIVLDRYLRGWSKRDVASDLGVTTETVNVTLRRPHVAAAVREEIQDAARRVQSLAPAAAQTLSELLRSDIEHVRLNCTGFLGGCGV